MKIDWQWPAALVFTVVFIALSSLVYLGKVPPTTLLALLSWLIPAPWTQKPAGS